MAKSAAGTCLAGAQQHIASQFHSPSLPGEGIPVDQRRTNLRQLSLAAHWVLAVDEFADDEIQDRVPEELQSFVRINTRLFPGIHVGTVLQRHNEKIEVFKTVMEIVLNLAGVVPFGDRKVRGVAGYAPALCG